MPQSTPGLTNFLAARRAEVRSSSGKKNNEFYVDIVIPARHPHMNPKGRSGSSMEMNPRSATPREMTPRPIMAREMMMRTSSPREMMMRTSSPREIMMRTSLPREMMMRTSSPREITPMSRTSREMSPRPTTPRPVKVSPMSTTSAVKAVVNRPSHIHNDHTHLSIRTTIKTGDITDPILSRSNSRTRQRNSNNNRIMMEDSCIGETRNIHQPPSLYSTNVMDATNSRKQVFNPQKGSLSFFSKDSRHQGMKRVQPSMKTVSVSHAPKVYERSRSTGMESRGLSVRSSSNTRAPSITNRDIGDSHMRHNTQAQDSRSLGRQVSLPYQNRTSTPVDYKEKDKMQFTPNTPTYVTTQSKYNDISINTPRENSLTRSVNNKKAISNVYQTASESNKPSYNVAPSTILINSRTPPSNTVSSNRVAPSPSGSNIGIEEPRTSQYVIGTTPKYNDWYNNITVRTPSNPTLSPLTLNDITYADYEQTPVENSKLLSIPTGIKTQKHIGHYHNNEMGLGDAQKRAMKISEVDELWRRLQMKESHIRSASQEGRAPPCRHLFDITKSMLDISDKYLKLDEFERAEIVASHVEMLLRWPRGSRWRNTNEDWLVLAGGKDVRGATRSRSIIPINGCERNTNESVPVPGSTHSQLEHYIEYHRQEQRSLALQRAAYAYSCQGRYHDSKRALEECIVVEAERRNQAHLASRRRACLTAIRASFDTNVSGSEELDFASAFLLRMQEINDAKVNNLSRLGPSSDSGSEGSLMTAYGLNCDPCLSVDVPVDLYINLISTIIKQVSSASSPDKVPFSRAAFDEARRRVLCISAALSYQCGRALIALKSPFLVAKLMVRGSLENRDFYTKERYKTSSELLCARLYLVDTLIGGIYAYYQNIVPGEYLSLPNDIKRSLEFVQHRFLVARVSLLLATCQRLGLEELGENYPLTQRAIDVIAAWSEWVSNSPFSLSHGEADMTNEHSERWVMQIKNAKKYLVFLQLVDTISSDSKVNGSKVNKTTLDASSPAVTYLTARSSHSFGLSLLTAASKGSFKVRNRSSTPIATRANSTRSSRLTLQSNRWRDSNVFDSSFDRSINSESMSASRNSKGQVMKGNSIKRDVGASPDEVILHASSGSPPKNAPAVYQSTPRRPKSLSFSYNSTNYSATRTNPNPSTTISTNQPEKAARKQAASSSSESYHPSLQNSCRDTENILNTDDKSSVDPVTLLTAVHPETDISPSFSASSFVHSTTSGQSVQHLHASGDSGNTCTADEESNTTPTLLYRNSEALEPKRQSMPRAAPILTNNNSSSTSRFNATDHNVDVTNAYNELIHAVDNDLSVNPSDLHQTDEQCQYEGRSIYSKSAKPNIRTRVTVTVDNIELSAPEIDLPHRPAYQMNHKYVPHTLHQPAVLEAMTRSVRKAPVAEPSAPIHYSRSSSY